MHTAGVLSTKAPEAHILEQDGRLLHGKHKKPQHKSSHEDVHDQHIRLSKHVDEEKGAKGVALKK